MNTPEAALTLVRNLDRLLAEGLDVALYGDHFGQSKHSPINYSVRLRKGDALAPDWEVYGRSTYSMVEALDRALQSMDAAGHMGAKLEPAAQTDEEHIKETL